MSSRYGNERVKRGLVHFLLGKGVSSIAGLLAVVLVVRGLSVPEFAAYSVLLALVEVFTAIAGLGLAHVILRYVPELYATHRAHSLRGLVSGALCLRTGVLVVALLAAAFWADLLAAVLKLDDFLPALQLFLWIVAFRSSSHILSQVLESTLHQGVSQLAFSAAALGRCLGMAWLLGQGSVSLFQVLALELACDVLACAILLTGLVKVLRTAGLDGHTPSDDLQWWPSQRRTIVGFAAAAYMQHLATLPFGGNTNRLVGGAMFGDRVMAGFGFALTLYEYVKRYLPTQLLVGVIRPVVVTRYTADGSFQRVAHLCEQSFQVNLALLLLITTPVAVAGAEILSLISAGKYGQDSAWLLLALLALLSLETRRVLLEVLAQTVERYDLMIRSNLLLSSSVLVGIAAFPWLGAIAFPIGNLAALVVANQAVGRGLSGLGFASHPDWAATGRALLIFSAAVCVGWLVRHLGGHWVAAAVAGLAVHLGLFMCWQLQAVRSYVKDLLGAR